MKSLVLVICAAYMAAPSVAQILNRCQNAPNGQTLPDLSKCEFFAVCNNRVENRMQCPAGRWFDYVANMCLPQETARCYVRENNNNNNDNYVCPSLGLSTLPHRSSCSKYVVCLNGQPIERECFSGLHWNAESQQCMTPDQAQCTVVDQPRCPMFVQNNTLTFLPSQNSCSKYFVCFNGDPIARECAFGLHWDPLLNSCIPASMSSCVLDGGQQPGNLCRNIDFDIIPFPSNCQKYIICMSGMESVQSCEPGTIFKASQRACVPGNVWQC